jgi:hypothetical protein
MDDQEKMLSRQCVGSLALSMCDKLLTILQLGCLGGSGAFNEAGDVI